MRAIGYKNTGVEKDLLIDTEGALERTEVSSTDRARDNSSHVDEVRRWNWICSTDAQTKQE